MSVHTRPMTKWWRNIDHSAVVVAERFGSGLWRDWRQRGRSGVGSSVLVVAETGTAAVVVERKSWRRM